MHSMSIDIATQAKFQKIKAENDRLRIDMGQCDSHVKRIGRGLNRRGFVFVDIRNSVTRRLKRLFNERMSACGLFGKPVFDHDAKTLELTIAHQGWTDSSLSDLTHEFVSDSFNTISIQWNISQT